MSFGGKSFKREELRMKLELQKLTKQSKNEFSGLNPNDKSKFLESSLKTALALKNQPIKRSRPAKSKQKVTGIENNESDGEVPPPSPSIDLAPELRSTPDSEIHAKAVAGVDCFGADLRSSDLFSRSTGVASIRSKVDLNVVMYGRGLQEETSAVIKTREKKSAKKPQSARSRSPRSPAPQAQHRNIQTKKPAIIGSQSTTVAVQLTPRPAQKQRTTSRASQQGSVRSGASSAKDKEILKAGSPTGDEDEGEADSALVTEANSEKDDRPKEVKVHTRSEDASGYTHDQEADEKDETRTVQVAFDLVENVEPVDKTSNGENDEQDENEKAEKHFISSEVLKTSISAPVLASGKMAVDSEEDSPINRIHSEILELTRRISQPEVGLLNLIRATEEAENEAKRLQEMASAASPARESLLLRAMAERGGTGFSIQGALRGLSPRDPKQLTSTSPMMPKPPVPAVKTKLQSDETNRARVSVEEKESSSTSPKKDRGMAMNSEMSAPAEINAKPQEAELLQTASKGTVTRRSGVTEMDVSGSPSLTSLTRQGLASQKTMTTEQAMECLLLPSEVVPEDIISIKGQQFEMVSKQSPALATAPDSEKQWIDLKQDKTVMFLDSWEVKEKKEKENDQKPVKTHNIHHFCTMPSRVELPPHLCRLTRDEHTSNKYRKLTEKTMEVLQEETDLAETVEEETGDEKEPEKPSRAVQQRRWSVVAQRILDEALVAGDDEETFNRLKRASDDLFSVEQEQSLDIVGVKIELKDDSSRLYWTPAPPKMNLAPATIKSQLYPEYQGAALLQESLGADVRTATGMDSEDNNETEAEMEADGIRYRVLSRTHESMTDLRKLVAESVEHRPKTDLGGEGRADRFSAQLGRMGETDQQGGPSRFVSVLDKRRHDNKEDDTEETEGEQNGEEENLGEEKKEKGFVFFRSASQPLLSIGDKDLKVQAGYDVSMNELNYQREQVAAIKEKQQEKHEIEDSILPQESSAPTKTTPAEHSTVLDLSHELDTDEGRTDAGDSMSIQTGTTGPTSRRRIPHQRRVKKKTKRELERERAIREFLNQPARKLVRCRSFTEVRFLAEETITERRESISTSAELMRVNSEPVLFDFDNVFKNEFSGYVC